MCHLRKKVLSQSICSIPLEVALAGYHLVHAGYTLLSVCFPQIQLILTSPVFVFLYLLPTCLVWSVGCLLVGDWQVFVALYHLVCSLSTH